MKPQSPLRWSVALLAAFSLSCLAPTSTPTLMANNADREAAPEFPENLDWLNVDQPLSLAKLKGKVVLLDFWTYCCINCIHIMPDLKRLEEKYKDELVVIGVHSAKFTAEQGTRNIREAILRYELTHPVVNDKDFKVWKSYGVDSWPTLVLIDPEGRIVGAHSGENIYDLLDRTITKVIDENKGKIDKAHIKMHLEKDKAPASVLSFPGKLAIDAAANRLWLSDSNHNRIVSFELSTGKVVDVIGAGAAGLKDGGFDAAQFNRPQGVAVDGQSVYVADTENHAIRKIDLAAKAVTTLAGTGNQAQRSNQSGKGVALNSPWDLLVLNNRLYIAMAGPHQLWTLDLKTLIASPYAGTTQENIQDGPLGEANLAQPSGIATDGKLLFFADSEVSAVRTADLDPDGAVHTLVGHGLFDFGDKDGPADAARFQHPLGITLHDGLVYVADTYNNKIRVVDPAAKTVSTLIGDGAVGMKDGPALQAQLAQPNDLEWANGKLYIADTNNNAIRIYDPAAKSLSTFTIANPDKLMARAMDDGAADFGGEVMNLPAQAILPGQSDVELSITIPAGYKINTLAPFYLNLKSADAKVADLGAPAVEQSLNDPKFPIKVPLKLAAGQTQLTADVVVYYCEAVKESVCLVKPLRIIIPLTVKPGAPAGPVKVEVAVPALAK